MQVAILLFEEGLLHALKTVSRKAPGDGKGFQRLPKSSPGNLCHGDQQLIGENQSTYIPLGCRHRLTNPGRIPVELIEVQSGEYLGEDDIVRFEDRYGRSDQRIPVQS